MDCGEAGFIPEWNGGNCSKCREKHTPLRGKVGKCRM